MASLAGEAREGGLIKYKELKECIDEMIIHNKHLQVLVGRFTRVKVNTMRVPILNADPDAVFVIQVIHVFTSSTVSVCPRLSYQFLPKLLIPLSTYHPTLISPLSLVQVPLNPFIS
jgi:hypothetical protein